MRNLHRLVTATATLSILALQCSTDPGTPTATGGTTSTGGTTGTGGSTTGGTTGGVTGGSTTGGTTGGFATGGTATGGNATGGTTGGSTTTGGTQGGGGASSAGASGAGASSGGAGGSIGGATTGGAGGGSAGKGSTGGAGGGSAGGKATGGSGGAGAVTFTQVASLLSTACAGSMCHGGTNHVNLVNMTDLYMRLTTPLPTSSPHCDGTTLVVPSNASGSFLLSVIKAPSTCMNGAATEQIPRMPNQCSTSSTNPRACLTATQIQLVEDWIAAGAPQ